MEEEDAEEGEVLTEEEMCIGEEIEIDRKLIRLTTTRKRDNSQVRGVINTISRGFAGE